MFNLQDQDPEVIELVSDLMAQVADLTEAKWNLIREREDQANNIEIDAKDAKRFVLLVQAGLWQGEDNVFMDYLQKHFPNPKTLDEVRMSIDEASHWVVLVTNNANSAANACCDSLGG